MTRREALASLGGAVALRAQRDAEYDRSVVSQIRIDLRDLGYPPDDVIPSDECAIRALAVAPNGAIYGATSGRRSHLFVLHPQHGYVLPLGVIPGITTVHRSLVVGAEGDVYIGGSIGVDNGGAGYQHYGGGHLLKYVHRDGENLPIRIGQPLNVRDLGAPVTGEGSYTLAIDRARGVIYGLSYPGGQFFSYSIAEGRSIVHGTVANSRIPGERFENEKAIGRALVVDEEGAVFTSGEGGRFYRFSPKDDRLQRLEISLPAAPGREVYNQVDAWAKTPDGSLFGGTSDGYLFRLDPKSFRVENLGKPLSQARIRGLAVTRSGKLCGAGGEDDEMARLFTYDPAEGSYAILGFLDVNHRPYYTWQAYVVDALVGGLDGTIYIGQAERKSKLYIYYPTS